LLVLVDASIWQAEKGIDFPRKTAAKKKKKKNQTPTMRFAVLRAVWLKNFVLLSRQRVSLLCTCVLSLLLLVGVAVLRTQTPANLASFNTTGSLEIDRDLYGSLDVINRPDALLVDARSAAAFGISGVSTTSLSNNTLYYYLYGQTASRFGESCDLASINSTLSEFCGDDDTAAAAIARLAPVLQLTAPRPSDGPVNVPLTFAAPTDIGAFWADVNVLRSFCSSCGCSPCISKRLPAGLVELPTAADDTLTLTYPYSQADDPSSRNTECDGPLSKQTELLHILTALVTQRGGQLPALVLPLCAYFDSHFDPTPLVEAALLAIGVSVLLPLFSSRPASDKETGTFTTVRIAGVTTIEYLVANFLTDISVYVVVLGAWLAVGAGVKMFILQRLTAPVAIMLLLNGVYLIMMANFIAFLTPSRAVSITMSYIAGLVLPAASLVAVLLLTDITVAINLVPTYALAKAVMQLGKSVGARATLTPAELVSDGWQLVGFHIAGMAVLAVLLFITVVGPVQSVRRILASFNGKPKSGKLDEFDHEAAVPLLQHDTVLVAKHLSKNYGDRAAVKDVSFSIGKAEVYGLLGVNGAGKSTLIKMLSGEIFPSAGAGFIGGQNVHAAKLGERPRIGVLPQHDVLFVDLTVLEHVLFFLRVKGVPRALEMAKADELLQRTGMAAQRSLYGTTLSGGQKRRLSLAIALAGDPVCLFCDEPSSSLDVAATRALWRVLNEVKLSQSVLLTSHNLVECDVLCDRIGIINNGRLIAEATPAAMKGRLSKHVSVAIQAAPHSLDEAIAFVRSVLPPDAAIVAKNTITSTVEFHAPTTDAQLKLSKLFSKLERTGAAHGIVNWSVD
jgi:ABC-type multidrug transport system ATPase subunit